MLLLFLVNTINKWPNQRILLASLKVRVMKPLLIQCLLVVIPRLLFLIFLQDCSYFLTLTPCLVFIVNSLRWLIIVYFGVKPCKKLLFWSSDVQNVADTEVVRLTDAPDHNFFPMIFVTGALVIVLAFFGLLARAPRPEDYDPISLTLSSTPFVCFLILVSILTMRMVKFEVVQGWVSFTIVNLLYCNYHHVNLEKYQSSQNAYSYISFSLVCAD